ncbi:deoxyribodipyrimidine photo-lyase (single-stranded DNA-specific) [Franzmannia pantelleriensis]|uniref:Cryptochrome DASH n=1 Tax=Franzmannia pantelleriensis TaxID=48727 RepID=A0A1G9PS28_9GAMM|nr:DASH family cryptochrome [Halomonas pantelleriensis]SDM01584.1 deoxyribodipyrimidine photo-lyase (single-stranded DNA-specific) [Halomonas pantelleriensis]
MSTTIVWLRHDLRVSDNPLFSSLEGTAALACVYVLDARELRQWAPEQSASRCGPARLRFLWQSLMALRGELLKRGSDLLVRIGDPVDIIAELALRLQADHVLVREEPGPEERAQLERLTHSLDQRCRLQPVESGMLFERGQLPFALDELPSSFSAFRRRLEHDWQVTDPRPAPLTLPLWPDGAPRGLPPLDQVCPRAAAWRPSDATSLDMQGGEEAARARLDHYLWDSNAVATYKTTRNGLLGADFSTRFSPWLAHGCLSARQVHAEVRAWEAEHGANASSYWVIFELLWRDYFYWAAWQEGAALFGAETLPAPDANLVAWCEGSTGVPFIDAAMRELGTSGWLSNRARQNVASFLVKDLGGDWRLGAAWFEHCLIDYDASSNWGNWRYVAGIGRDPRQHRYFNVLKQARHYDPQGDYVAHWLPALQTLPQGASRHQPWQAAPARFAAPLVEPPAWREWRIPALGGVEPVGPDE